MRRNDEVFLLTLIDFLLQICFFGLLVGVALNGMASAQRAEVKRASAAANRLRDAMGISDLTTLTDVLTKLAPASELEKMAVLKKTLREQGIQIEDLPKRLDALKKFEEGFGKSPCLYDTVNGKKVSRPVATAVATDVMIEFQSSTAELEQILRILETDYQSVSRLTLVEFARQFSRLPEKRPECFYSLRLIERTDRVHARDAANSGFYVSVQR